MKELFMGSDGMQLSLFELAPVLELNKLWDKAEAKERKSRTVFAQHAINPEEVSKELEAVDAILGDPGTVERFIKAACQRLEVPLNPKVGYYEIDLARLPEGVRLRLPQHMTEKLAFDQPVAAGITYISRTHPLTAALAEHLIDNALNEQGDRTMSSRCGVIKSSQVDTVTSLLLLRLRYVVQDSGTQMVSMAEECVLNGFKGLGSTAVGLEPAVALSTWEQAKPAANISSGDKTHWGNQALGSMKDYQAALNSLLKERTGVLLESYERVRKTVKSGKVTIQANPDIDVLSVAVIVPVR
jgi:hypothetical protein